MAGSSPLPPTITQCGYGISPREVRALPSSIVAIPILCVQWHGRPMASSSLLAVLITPYRYGMLAQETPSILILVTITGYIQWHGHPLASSLPLAVLIRRYRYGR